jgi:hypothetical protein
VQESKKPIGDGVFGNIYDQFKGKIKEALDFIMEHKDGDLLGVFHRSDAGDIDLVWGDDKGGFAHIINKHVGEGKSFANAEDAIRDIDNIIKNGDIDFENGDKVVFIKDGKKVTIRKNIREKGKKIADKNWVLTAYDLSASDGSSAITTTNQGEAAPATDKSASKDTAKTSDSQEDEKKRTEKDKGNTSNFDFDEIEELKDAPRSVRTAIRDYAVNAYNRAILKVPAFQFGIPEEKQERMTFEKFRDEFNDDAEIFAKGTEKYLPVVYEYINKQLDAKRQEKAEGKKEEKTDSQGNPINEDGTLKVEQIGSIDELTDEDFNTPTRNVQLPTLSENVANAIGTDGKAVVIKKNIFEKNKRDHKDLTAEQSREILKSALYNPQLYGQNQKAKRPYNWVVINTKDEAGHNRLVLLEVNNNKDNVEIVHWHYVDQRGVEKIKRQAEREDGQLLILPSDSSEEVGALSDPTQDLPSEGKDSKSGAEKQGKGKKNDRKKRKTKSDLIDELGQPVNVREWIMRSLYRREYKFIWDSNGKTKGLGQHLGLADSKAERKSYFWMLAGKDKGGMYPESVAEAMTEQINDDLGLTGEARVNSIDVLNELLDVVGSYSSQSRMFDAIFDIHKGIENGISDEEAEYLGNESLAKSR